MMSCMERSGGCGSQRIQTGVKLGVVYHCCLTDNQVLHCQGKDSLALTAMLGKSSIMSWICE